MLEMADLFRYLLFGKKCQPQWFQPYSDTDTEDFQIGGDSFLT